MFLQGITVAMADDAVQQLSRNKAVCLKYGMNIVGVFTNGSDLLTAIEGGLKPQVILLDVVMRGLTGVQVTQQLRAKSYLGKIILVTSMGQKSVSNPAMVGADYLLIKPFPDEWFLTAVLSVIDNEEVPTDIENPAPPAPTGVTLFEQPTVVVNESQLDA